MRGSAVLVRSIRALLKQRGMTYRQLAALIGVSEPTVKRDLGGGDFSLGRLDRICEALDVTLAELVRGEAGAAPALTQLSETQERALVRDPRLFVVAYLLVNDWRFADIVTTFRFEENDLVKVLLRLDQLRVIDYRPPHRVKKLTARNFAWRKDGPVHAFFVDQVAPEFLRGHFDQPGEELHFLGGVLTAQSRTQLQALVSRLVDDFEEMARQDAKLPSAERDGCGVLIALRAWEYSEITRLRRR